MIWDILVIFLILAFSYALAFKEDVPSVVTNRSFLFFFASLIILNIIPIMSYLARVVTRVLFNN